MSKLYAYVIAALVAVVGVGGLFWWGQQGHQAAREGALKLAGVQTQLLATEGALRGSIQAAATNRKLSEARLAVAEKQRRAAQAKAKELERALQDNPEWANGPVPDSVWDSIGPAADRQESPRSGATR